MSIVKGHMSHVSFVFFGTPELSVEILEHLKANGYVPSLVVTNPDRPKGRKMMVTPPPVKLWALKNHVVFLQPENLKDFSFLNTLHATRYTLFIVVAYGKILPKKVLEIPEKGSLNIHYSLLPKYRGASPIESQILNDDKDMGVSILLLDEKMDHGPIVERRALQITNHNKQIPNNIQITNGDKNIQTQRQLSWPPRAGELRSAMNKLAGELLAKTIPDWIAGNIKAKEQNHAEATYTKKFTKADGEIDLSGNPYKNFLKIRAFDDTIGSYFFVEVGADPRELHADTRRKKKVRVLIKEAKFENGKLILTRIIPEGKKEISYEEFLRGLR